MPEEVAGIMDNQPALAIHNEILQQIRTLLAAIQREAGNKGATELVDLAEKADTLAAQLLHLKND